VVDSFLRIPMYVAIGSGEKVYRLSLEKAERAKYVQDANAIVSQFSRTK